MKSTKDIAVLLDEPACEHNKKEKSGCAKPKPGAGGVHCLTHPEIAEPLRALKLDHFKNSAADYLVSTNLGCALQLNSGMTSKQSADLPKVIHPIVLIAKALNH